MIRGESVLCLSSIDWDFNWQGHQEIMATLARQGNRVLFIENTGVRRPRLSDWGRLRRRLANWRAGLRGFRQAQENVWVLSPLILPFPYGRLSRWINQWLLLRAIRRWLAATDGHDPILWTFLPTGTALDVLTRIPHKLAVYYCIADFEALADRPSAVRRTEREVVRRCDLVFAQGEALARKCRQWSPAVHVFPFGVCLEAFTLPPQAREAPVELRRVSRPIIGYVGGLHRHVDFPLLARLAGRRDWSLVLVGPLQTEAARLPKADNVFLLGEKPFEQLADYVRQFDVCIIPYVQSDYTRTVYPTKLNEYHALGKPVVSTALPELLAFNERYGSLIRLADTPARFVEQVEQALGPEDAQLAARRRAVAQEHAWSARIEQMARLMEEALQRKAEAGSVEWQWRLLAAYRQVRRRALWAALGTAAAALAAFYSPLLWWVAEPLRVRQPAQAADAIVVFAGGVGESGIAGQGYEERVARAVELYRQGLAPTTVFSSGYLYAMNETAVMQALAVSMGVPPSAILLESHARNTLENVQFTSAIARRNGWRSLLLVSSPYHMRRSLLTFRKQAPELRVTPAPMTDSVFFRRGPVVALAQWRAILHEYAGIVYYWLKGWL
jgi:uncharacterized SAM-binding protein YcdF (DUF218 family)